MAAAMGCGSVSLSSWAQFKESSSRKSCNKKGRFRISSSSVSDPYKTLSIRPTASESEVKKAFRQLAKKYHPDVCKESKSGIEFHQINEAYDVVMRKLRGEVDIVDEEEATMGEEWDIWEEWMGWEGAGIRDYSSHINPYI